jgi:hypothetical protein
LALNPTALENKIKVCFEKGPLVMMKIKYKYFAETVLPIKPLRREKEEKKKRKKKKNDDKAEVTIPQ